MSRPMRPAHSIRNFGTVRDEDRDYADYRDSDPMPARPLPPEFADALARSREVLRRLSGGAA